MHLREPLLLPLRPSLRPAARDRRSDRRRPPSTAVGAPPLRPETLCDGELRRCHPRPRRQRGGPGRGDHAARHRLPLRRDAVVRRRSPQPVRPEPPGDPPRRRPPDERVEDRHRGLLRSPQGRAAPAGARRPRRLGDRAAPVGLGGPPSLPVRARRSAARRGEDQSTRRLDRRTRGDLPGGLRPPRPSPRRPRLPLRRMLAVHPAGRRRCRPAVGPMGRFRQDRMRVAPVSAETIKIESRYLGGTIGDELAGESDDFGHDAELLLKFHGIYQQDDRDVRRARTKLKLPLDYSCMVRASVPGGVIEADQWLALDRVAALAACGDVVRNVMACPLPHPERTSVLQPVIDEMVARFRPQTESYWELWVDGEQAVTAEPATVTRSARPQRPDRPPVLDPVDAVEPVYGNAYLPRKFKIAIAWPGDNCVDVYTNDVGIVPTLSDGTTGELTGFMVLAGGGMGMSHNRPDDTYPLLAQPVGWVAAPAGVAGSAADSVAALGDVVEAIVTAQRDHGNREDRSRARLKYLVEERGIGWLRDQIEQRTGRRLEPPVDLPPWEVHAHHGWHRIGAALGHGAAPAGSALGLPVPSGKVAGGLRAALKRLIADGTVRQLRVTPRQDLLLLGVTDREAVENVLRGNGVRLADDQSPTRNLAVACPALPTCSKALGEAERVLPDVVDRLEKLLADTGNTGLPLRLNMTGCPNGCSRPYAAEVGIVGRTKKNYDVFVGGSPAGDRLARLLRADVPLTDVPDLLRPLLEAFSRSITDGTDDNPAFGDWCVAQDWTALQALLPAPTPARRPRTTSA